MRVTGQTENRKTTALINAALDILAEQNPMTIRQLFYRLVSKQRVQNNLQHYQLVSRIMTKARDDGRCPFEWIADRSRPVYASSGFDDAVEYVATMRDGYRKNYWTTQPEHIEVWVEKDAIIGSIEKTCNDLGVTIRVGRGYWSTTAAHAIAKIFSAIDKPITVFYCGDHDPSGQNIQSELYSRILEYDSGDFEMERLAISKEDIAKFNLPPLAVKNSDSRAAGFVKQYGNECVELDALPPLELRRRISEAVKSHIDDDLWTAAKAIETAEKLRIHDAVNQVSSMTDDDAPKWATFQSVRDDYPVLWQAISDPESKGCESINAALTEPLPNAGEMA
jgi:hypothetical protein